MTRVHNASHLGEVLWEYLGDITVTHKLSSPWKW